MSKPQSINGIFSSKKEMFTFKRIGDRVLILVGIVVLLGLIGISMFHTTRQQQAILSQNERAVHLLMQSVSKTFSVVMLSGNATIAKQFAEDLKSIPNVKHFQILRVDGTEAFQDNQTIHTINNKLGIEMFQPRGNEKVVPILQPDRSELLEVLKTQKEISFYEKDPVTTIQTLSFLAPILPTEACHQCHTKTLPVLGAIRLITDMDQAKRELEATREEGFLILAATLAILLATIFFLIHRSVAMPIKRMTHAMQDIAGGDLGQRVPVIGRDELSKMALSFNKMSNELERIHLGLKGERDKLTTIILSSQDGIVVTNANGDVVLVNPATEQLLGKTGDQINRGGFLNLLDDQDYMSALLKDFKGGVIPSTVVYNNRILNVYAATIRSSDDLQVGSAALIRDITQEKQLEQTLRTLSTTDALTTLNNRRRFDEILDEEFRRSLRYNRQSLTMMMLDVDHFKRFNDEHGHDQGDRVLQALGALMHEEFREVDHPCRYGGEEFCVILPNTDYSNASVIAERFRKRVEDMVVDGLKVTVSIGAAIYPGVGKSAEDLVKQADNALYQAKRAGRNQVCFCTKEDQEHP